MMANNFFSFGRTAAEQSTKKTEFNPDYFNYFNLKVDQEALIRILNHDIITFVEHSKMIDGKPRKIKCTGDWEPNGNRCVGCYYATKDSSVKVIATRQVYIATVLDLRPIHMINDPSAKRPMARPCTGKRCNMCQAGLSFELTGKKHWTLGSGHYGVLQEANLKIGDHCLTCKKGTINIDNLLCSKCGEPLFSDSQLGSMDEKALKTNLFKVFTCQHCGNKSYPEEQVSCSECDAPVRASLYDTNLKVSKIKSADGGKYTTLAIEPTYGWEPIPKEFAAIQPFDFDSIFAKLDLNVQAGYLKVANPWGKQLGVSEGDIESMGIEDEVLRD